MATVLTPKKQFRFYDPGLPFLAAEAAFELDNLVVGKPSSFEKVALLLERLNNSFDRRDENDLQPLIDSASAALVFDALTGSMTEKELVTNWVLLEQALADAKNSGTPPANEQSAVEKMRDFFIALSRRAGAIRIQNEPQLSPYRS